jgi:hypothetical protein
MQYIITKTWSAVQDRHVHIGSIMPLFVLLVAAWCGSIPWDSHLMTRGRWTLGHPRVLFWTGITVSYRLWRPRRPGQIPARPCPTPPPPPLERTTGSSVVPWFIMMSEWLDDLSFCVRCVCWVVMCFILMILWCVVSAVRISGWQCCVIQLLA